MKRKEGKQPKMNKKESEEIMERKRNTRKASKD